MTKLTILGIFTIVLSATVQAARAPSARTCRIRQCRVGGGCSSVIKGAAPTPVTILGYDGSGSGSGAGASLIVDANIPTSAPAPATEPTPPPPVAPAPAPAPDPAPAVAPAPAPAPSPESSSSNTNIPSSSSNPGGDAQTYLTAHNTFRAQHGAPALSWSDELAGKAQQWADGCKFVHSGGALGRFGENLAAGTGNYGPADGVKGWTDEAPQYNPSSPQASHFTQVVWKASTQLGCASALCDGIFDASFGKARFIVCEYAEAGNVLGKFAENVSV